MSDFQFVKMNGLGNSFILMTDLEDEVSSKVDIPNFAKGVCGINFGIGADGLILAKKSDTLDFRMVIINADGSEAEMCGNGIRCFARYLVDSGLTDKTELEIETLAGKIVTRIKGGSMVEVDMGSPVFKNEDVVGEGSDSLVEVESGGRGFTFVSMGNPHAVAFVDDFEFDWRSEGARVERDEDVFPNHTNVEYVKVESDTELTMKVWERGCGETMACGTGTCALVVAGVEKGIVKSGDVNVHLPGGDLSINYSSGDNVLMTGPAVRVCSGVYSFGAK